MLQEFNRYENLGTPNFFFEIFKHLATQERTWTALNVKQYFYNRVVDGLTIFDGCLPFAEAVGAVTINHDGHLLLNPALIKPLVSEHYLSNKLLEMILVALKDDDIFHEIFCSKHISYDIIYKLIQIDNAAFRLRYANIRKLLISFGFLFPHPDNGIRKLVINTKYKRLFDKELMPSIKRRKFGITQLEKLLAQKQIYGKEAEAFALQFERERLAIHPQLTNVEIISEYDVGAGYDIVSYENPESHDHDRFIEVKSFSGIPSFHWSRNEMEVARIKRAQYFLYLVDRSKMGDGAYVPYIIQNPHERIIEKPTQWEKRVEDYFVTQMLP